MKKLIDSFNAAIEGFFYAFLSQRNMRIHFLTAISILLLAIYLNFTRVELMLLCITASLVLITEMLNTSIEIILDKVSRKYAHWVRRVKDVAAAAVLVASINALIVGYFLFFRNVIFTEFTKGMTKIAQSDWHISFFILILLIGIVLVTKSFFRRGRPLRGGMPSGHAAVAFSVLALVALISQNPLLVFTVFILAIMISQSRISRHYHTFWEVFVGGCIGFVVTVMVYRLLSG